MKGFYICTVISLHFQRNLNSFFCMCVLIKFYLTLFMQEFLVSSWPHSHDKGVCMAYRMRLFRWRREVRQHFLFHSTLPCYHEVTESARRSSGSFKKRKPSQLWRKFTDQERWIYLLNILCTTTTYIFLPFYVLANTSWSLVGGLCQYRFINAF